MKKITKADMIRSKEWSMIDIQNDLFALIEKYMLENNLTRTALANKLGVTKGYITQVLNGDFDHKISKLVELTLACGAIPLIHFVNLNEFIENDANDIDYELVPIDRQKLYEKRKALGLTTDGEPSKPFRAKKKKTKAVAH